MKQLLILLALSGIFLTACKVQNTKSSEKTVEEKTKEQSYTPHRKADKHIGIIQKQGITTYQYGSHILKTEDTFYALRSTDHDLNDYVGKKVKVITEKIAGYPISGGPEFILVLRIEVLEDKPAEKGNKK